MKIILSRKGCDSSFGGMPGIILPDGRIVFVPIPAEDADSIRYGGLVMDREKGKLVSLMGQVFPCMRINEKKFHVGRDSKCHLDPDLSRGMYPREEGWRGCFGQIGAAQTVLQKSNVGVGDVFLFFGWFNHTEEKGGKLRFCKGQGRFLKLLAVFFSLLYCLYIIRAYIQGFGNSVIPMASSFVQVVMRVGCALLLTRLIGNTGIFWGEVMAWTGADIFLVVFLVGNWKRMVC